MLVLHVVCRLAQERKREKKRESEKSPVQRTRILGHVDVAGEDGEGDAREEAGDLCGGEVELVVAQSLWDIWGQPHGWVMDLD